MAVIKSLKDKRVKRKVDRLFQKVSGEWEQKTTAELGNEFGVVKTEVPGVVYARLRNGDTKEVYNNVAPEDHGVKVWIGRRKITPTIWEVIAQRDSYSVPQAPRLSYHAAQHKFRGPDEVPIDRKQIMQHTIIVYDADDFIVLVYGGPITTAAGDALVATQFVDLAPHLPAAGALFVAIQTDADGVLTVVDGTGFAAPDLGTAADFPAPSSGNRRIGWVLLFAGQEELLDEHIYVPMPLEINFSDMDSLTIEQSYAPVNHTHPTTQSLQESNPLEAQVFS